MDKELKQNILGYLKGHPICVVSTASKSGKPESATVYNLVTDEFDFYFMTNAESRKATNLEENNRVSLVVGTDFDPRTVQVDGTARKIEDEEEVQKYLKQLENAPHLERLYRGNFVAKNPFQPHEDADYILYKLSPDWMRWTHLDPDEGKMKVEEFEF